MNTTVRNYSNQEALHHRAIASRMGLVPVALALLLTFSCRKISVPDPSNVISESSLIVRVAPLDATTQSFRVIEVLKQEAEAGRSLKTGDVLHLSPPQGIPVSTSTHERLVFLGKQNRQNDIYEQRSYMECEIIDEKVDALNAIRVSEIRALVIKGRP
jgi:hypothetical protein